ncbi:MAG: HTTM domain-containing protein, partial [Bdellovibrionales bacterium]|nr:HTTM domain-containing protein [Bdellovibrionales bacterium]
MERVKGGSDALTGFSGLWAAATLFSLLSNRGWSLAVFHHPASAQSMVETALLGAAILVLARPSSLLRVTALSLIQLLDVAVIMPLAPNHRLVLAFGNLLLLAAIVRIPGAFQGDASARADVFQRFAPAANWLTAIVYFFAFFAKLTTEFVDPATSCAAQFFGHVAEFLPLVPDHDAVVRTIIWGTILFEGALPFLLLARRTRRAGVLLGIAFHFCLAFDTSKHFFDFSSVMSALLLLFADPRVLATFAVGEATQGRPRAIALSPHTAALVLLPACSVTSAISPLHWTLVVLHFKLIYLTWLLYGLTLLVGVVRTQYRYSGQAQTIGVPKQLLPLAILCAAVLNGFSPYLGIKTRTG